MRILWFSSKVLSPEDEGKTATWIGAMAQALVRSGAVTLGNIALGNVDAPSRRDHGPIQQWIVPFKAVRSRSGALAAGVVNDVVGWARAFGPDLVHVWGTEHIWGLLTARKLVDAVALVDIQGLKYTIAEVYHGGLTTKEQLGCVGLKEMVRRETIWQNRSRFRRWGAFEKEIISGHRYISAHSRWAAAQARGLNPDGTIFRNDRMLRAPFYEAAPWRPSDSHRIFCSAAYSTPFKGLHVAIRAVAILRRRFPDILLCIAGNHQKKGLRQGGYAAWMDREVKRLGLEKNILWLGALPAEGIVEQLRASALFLAPSFVESYCVALAEAMILGVPSVVSYAGGLACLAQDNESALYFPPGDAVMCAFQMARLLEDRTLAQGLSRAARKTGLTRNDPEKITSNQLEIYRVLTQGRCAAPEVDAA
jgi:glycosyltransferase involved in cell wall biosynthesis